MTKMTDEELAQAKRVADFLNEEGTSTVHRLLADVTALTAELKNLRAVYEEGRGERDTLRERVTALEGERDALRAQRANLSERVMCAERDLAALRQRAGDWEGLREHVNAETATLLNREECAAVAGYILGEGAQAPARQNVCEHGDHPAPEGRRFCSPACEECEHTFRCKECPGDDDDDVCPHVDEGGCAGVCAPAPVSEMDGMRGEMADARCKHGLDNPSVCAVCEDDAEPTTAEACARVQVGLTAGVDVVDREHARDAISLLECRMGAQEAALRALIDLGLDGPVTDMARAALTDATPVFTPEEVEDVILAEWPVDREMTPNAFAAKVRKALAALRR